MFDRRCIVKGFRQEGKEVASRMETMRQEVARLDEFSDYPQLPRIFGYFERDTQQFWVMEFVKGRNLLQQMTEEGPFSEEQIRQLLQEVLPLLQLLHDRHLIHRDIKPTNLIRRTDTQVLTLVDFSTLKLITPSALHRPGTVLGSAEYAAPEQLMGQAVLPSDLYSLGVTCIHLLTGLRPFDLFNSATGTWLWRNAAPDVSDDLARTLDRLLQGSVQARYQTAAAVLRDLSKGQPMPRPVGAVVHQRSVGPPASPRATPSWTLANTLTVGVALTAIALFPQEPLVVCSGQDGSLHIWDWHQGKCLKTLPGRGLAIATVAVLPDGDTIAAGGAEATIALWNWRTTTLLRTLEGHPGGTHAIALAADGRTLVSGGQDRCVHQWDWQVGTRLHSWTGHRAAVEAIALAGDTMASGSGDGAIHLWHVQTRELLRVLPAHKAAVRSLVLLTDGSPVEEAAIASGGWDMAVQLRRVATGRVYHTFSGHLLPVTSMAIAPAHSWLATGSHDRTITLWHLITGELLGTLKGHGASVEAVAFSPQHNVLLSAGQDGTLRLWTPS